MVKKKHTNPSSESLSIICKVPFGKLGNDDSPENPLARALNRLLLLDGQPFHGLNHCYFKPYADDHRWLGTFVHSAGDRILFFPGFADTKKHIKGYQNQRAAWDEPFIFDHASLKADRKSWHLTTPGSSEHLGGPVTLDLGQNRVLWFGLSIAHPTVLREVLSTLTIVATIPPSDSRRRGDVIRKAGEYATQLIVTTNTEHAVSTSENFLHFAFAVGPKDFPEYNGPELGAPFGSPFYRPPISNLPIPIRRHRMTLSNTVDIQITCASILGSLSCNTTITSPATPLNR